MKKSYLVVLMSLILAFGSTFAVSCKDGGGNNGGGNSVESSNSGVIDDDDEAQTTPVAYALAFDSFSMINGQTLTLDAKLLADGALADGEISYTSSDSSVISISNGVATANKLGSVEIKASAKLGGETVSEKTISCSVSVSAGIVTNQHSYTVYITDKIHDTVYEKTSQLSAEVFVSGSKVSGANVTWEIGDSSIATISQSGLISAVKVGKTYAVGTYQGGTSEELKTVNIPVEVAVPVLSTDMNVILDVTQSECAIDANTVLGNGKVASKLVNVKTLQETPVSSGLVPTEGFRTGEYRYVVYDKNGLMGCEVNLIVADYVVDSKSDFMQLHEHFDSEYVAIACDLKNVGGYSCPVESGEFDGVFNGLGHTISGLTVNAYGIFNDAADGATFKNVSFTDVTIIGSNSGVFFFRGHGTNYFENIYLEVDSISSNAWGSGTLFAFCFNGTVNVKNCIIEAKGPIDAYNGAVLGRSSGNFIYKNFYVISTGAVCGNGKHTWNRNYDELNKLSIMYKTRNDFITERYAEDSLIDLSTFNAYWDLSKDVPTFK